MSSKLNKKITINQQSLTILNKIGKGSYATVYKASMSTKDGNDNETPVAIKIIKNTNILSNNQKNSNNILNNIEVEINILKRLKNPNIVKLITYSIPKTLQDDDSDNTNEYYKKSIILVMEFCDIGDLSNIIRFSNKDHQNEGRQASSTYNYDMLERITERFPKNSYDGLNCVLVYSFIKQIANALYFIQSKNLIHRDIKPQNLLLTSHPHGLVPYLKIADFGFARFLPQQSMAETLCGSPQWMAPEILSYKKYDAKIDLWSIGCVIYEMCFGKPAFHAKNYIDLLNKIKTIGLKFPTSKLDGSNSSLSSSSSSSLTSSDDSDDDSYDILDENMENLITRLLTYDPIKRMSFEEFFSHHLVKDFGNVDKTFDVESLLSLKQSESHNASKTSHVGPITYNEVFDSSSDDEYEDEDKYATASQQYSEKDGYLMIPNEAIITTNEFPINAPRRKSKLLSRRASSNHSDHGTLKNVSKLEQGSSAQPYRRESGLSTNSSEAHEEKKRRSSSFAGMTKAITKAFRSASISSNNGSQQFADTSTQYSDISKVRQLSKTHVFMKYLKQEESNLYDSKTDDLEILIQLKIWFLSYLKRQMDVYRGKDYETLRYFNDKFDKVLDSVEIQYKLLVNVQASNEGSIHPDKDTWSAGQVQDVLWKLSQKFARLGYKLETKRVVDKAALAYATSLWFLDFIVTDFDFVDIDDNKYERMCVLTGDRLSAVYKY
ncbi:hypothetical protein ACO0OL_002248 [Hanseniaspora opuntiae]